MDTVGEFRSGHQPHESRRPRRRTRDAPQPVRDPVDVDRRRRRHVLQPRLGQTDVPAPTQAEPADPLRQRPLHSRARTAYSAFHSAVSCCRRAACSASCCSRGRSVISRPSVVARVHNGRLRQARHSRRANSVWITSLPHRSRPGFHRTLVLPSGHVTRWASQSIVKWAMSNPWFACACQLTSGRTGRPAAPRARTGCPPATRRPRIRRRAGDRPAASPWPPTRHGSAPSGPRRRPRPGWSPRS